MGSPLQLVPIVTPSEPQQPWRSGPPIPPIRPITPPKAAPLVVVPAHGFPAVAPSAVEDVVVLVLPPAALAGDVGAAKDQGRGWTWRHTAARGPANRAVP